MSDLYALAALDDGTYGFIDSENHFTAVDGSKAWPGNGPLRLVCKDKKYGFIDRTGAWHIEPTFDLANRVFHEGMCRVKKDGKFGYIDMSGTLVIPCVYAKASGVFSHGRALVSEDGTKYGYIDTTGVAVTKFKYKEDSHRFINGFAAVLQGRRWGYIDESGTEVIKPAYNGEYAGDFGENGIVRASEGGRGNSASKHHFLRVDGTPITAMELVSASNFSDGLARFAISDGERGAVRSGFMDEAGEVAFWMKGKSVQTGPVGSGYEPQEYREQLLAARDYSIEEYRCGYMDLTGEFAIAPEHRYTYQFKNGFAFVGNDAWEWTHIDREGRMLTDYQYGLHAPAARNNPRHFSEDRVAVFKDDRFALMDTAGKELTEFDYTSMGDLTNGFAQVRKDSKWGFIDPEGKLEIPCTYKTASTFQPWPELS